MSPLEDILEGRLAAPDSDSLRETSLLTQSIPPRDSISSTNDRVGRASQTAEEAATDKAAASSDSAEAAASPADGEAAKLPNTA